MREAILHSLEYFNGKLRKYKLRMDANIYLLEENGDRKTGGEAAPELQTSNLISSHSIVLHPSQNLYDTKIENFTLQLKESRCIMRRKNRDSLDDSDSMRTSSSDEEMAKLKKMRKSTLNKSKVKASI